MSLAILSDATATTDPAARLQGEVVGSGPFELEEYTQDQGATIVRRDGYAWPSDVSENPGEAYLDQIDFSIVPESGVRSGGLASDQFDAVGDVLPQDVPQVEGSGGAVLTRTNPGRRLRAPAERERRPAGRPGRAGRRAGGDQPPGAGGHRAQRGVQARDQRAGQHDARLRGPVRRARVRPGRCRGRARRRRLDARCGRDPREGRREAVVRRGLRAAVHGQPGGARAHAAAAQGRRRRPPGAPADARGAAGGSRGRRLRHVLLQRHARRRRHPADAVLVEVPQHQQAARGHGPGPAARRPAGAGRPGEARRRPGDRAAARSSTRACAIPLFELAQSIGVGADVHGLAFDASSRLLFHDTWIGADQ